MTTRALATLVLGPLTLSSCAVAVSFDGFTSIPPPAREPPVRVTVDARVPEATVVFHDSAGAVLDVQRASKEGIASSEADAKQVTIVVDDPTDSSAPPTLLTYAGVEQGESVKAKRLGAAPTLGAMAFNVPPLEGAGDTFSITAFAGSRTASVAPPLTLELEPAAVQPDGTIALIASARGVTPSARGFIVAKGIRATVGQRAPFALEGQWRSPSITQVSARLPEAPARALALDLALKAVVGHLEGGLGLELLGEPAAPTESGAKRFFVPDGLADELVAYATVEDGSSRRWVIREQPPPAGELPLDATVLPAIDGQLDTRDRRWPLVRWSGTPASSVGAIVEVTAYSRTSRPTVWTFVEPAATRERVVPALPPEVATRLLPATTFVVRIEVYDGEALKDFGAFKRFWNAPTEAPPRGRLRISALELRR